MLYRSRRVTVPLLYEDNPESKCSVEGLLAHIQRGVRIVRDENPELEAFQLHDVKLCVANGNLVAELDFRK